MPMEACVGGTHICLPCDQSDIYQGLVGLPRELNCNRTNQDLTTKARCSDAFLRQRKRHSAKKFSVLAAKSSLHPGDVFNGVSGRRKLSSCCRFHNLGITLPSKKKRSSCSVERRELRAATCFAELESDSVNSRKTNNLCSCPEDLEWDGGWFGGHAAADDREDEVTCVQRWHRLDCSSGKLLPQEEFVEIVDVGDTSSLSVKRNPFGLSAGHDDGLLSPSRWRKNVGAESGDPICGDAHLEELVLPVNLGLAEGGFSGDISADVEQSPPMNWPYERPKRDELSDLQMDVALAIPSWYYRISGKQQDFAYGHDLEEGAGSHGEELESLEAKTKQKSIILIPPYQRVALATELLIASFTGGGISSDEGTDHQGNGLKEEKKPAFMANLPSLPLDNNARVIDWEEWSEGAEIDDTPGFFLAPDEEAMLSRLSSTTSAEWDADANPNGGGKAAGRPFRTWLVLFASVVVGCLAGLMAMKSEAPVLAVDLLLITWSATVTAMAAACVGVLRRNGRLPQPSAYEAPAKQALWSRVVLIMGFIAGLLAASTCLALIVRATVGMLVHMAGGIASLFSKVVGTAALSSTLHSVGSSTAGSWASLMVLAEELTKAVPHVLWGCGWGLFVASMPVLLMVLGLLLISGTPDDNMSSHETTPQT